MMQSFPSELLLNETVISKHHIMYSSKCSCLWLVDRLGLCSPKKVID